MSIKWVRFFDIMSATIAVCVVVVEISAWMQPNQPSLQSQSADDLKGPSSQVWFRPELGHADATGSLTIAIGCHHDGHLQLTKSLKKPKPSSSNAKVLAKKSNSSDKQLYNCHRFPLKPLPFLVIEALACAH
jgi:hypothetical protein